MKRQLVFWGIGNICRTCLRWNEKVVPDFYIDEKTDCTVYNGKKVVRSCDITEWKDLFIVIAVVNDLEIKAYLRDKGLVEKQDFISYRDFFCEDEDMYANLDKAREVARKVSLMSQPVMLVAPLFTTRQNNKMVHFFKEYISSREKETFVIQTNLEVLSEENASKVLGAHVISEPKICMFDNPVIDKNKELSRYENEKIFLTNQENMWIEEMESRKVSDKDDLRLSSILYQYTQSLIDILKPKCLIIWGGWSRYSYILEQIATEKKIPYGFMEYGWLPGTFQFDPCGIAGQGICATREKRCKVKKLTQEEDNNISQVFKYITDNQLDTRSFRTNSQEIDLLNENNAKKILSFIGMSITGTGIRPGSEYWKKYISDVFDTIEEAVESVAKICLNNSIQMVFKPHPDMVMQQPFIDMLRKYNVMLVRDISIDYLIEMSDVFVSMASAVDYKVLIYRKPLVKIGQTGMNEKGCTYEVHNSSELQNNILWALENGQTQEQQQNYRYYIKELLDKYLWDDLEDRPTRYGRDIKEDFLP